VIFKMAWGLKMPGPASGASLQRVKEFVATMAIGLLNPATDCSTAQPCSNASAEIGQTQQRPQCGAFSVLLKDVVRNIDDRYRGRVAPSSARYSGGNIHNGRQG
jgi:hypothetical protein